nr:LysR family transcriptional regulator [Salinisphaera sp. LB1]
MADAGKEMRTFVQIGASGSLAAAARALGLSTAVVSRRLSALERRLNTRLVHRTTRRLSLTDEGARYLHRCEQILADIEAADAEAMGETRRAAGRLRITTTVAFADRLAPLLERLAAMHPELAIHLHAGDARVNLTEEGIDVAVRFGRSPIPI